MKTSAPHLRTIARVPAHAMPHVWSPLFVDRDARAVDSGLRKPAASMGTYVGPANGAGRRIRPFGFRHPGAGEGWRIAIMEPNVSVAKSCFVPMLACDQAYRTDPTSVAYMMVMNSEHMKEHLTFNRFAARLDLTRAGKASYEPRLPFVECMTDHSIDAVVSHQWENAQNYLYYDALYGGYPLVHNSEFLRDAGMGFYYPGFEATAGARALLQAWHEPPEYWAGYRARAADYLKTLAPDHEANIRAFAGRIAELCGAGR
jgi:hypothetical protein